MSRKLILLVLLAASLLAFFIVRNWPQDPLPLDYAINAIEPLHQTLGSPKPGEWLADHPENGQTYRQYINSFPNVLSAHRNTLYVQPIGDFDDAQRQMVEISSEFLGIYFNCPVEILETKSESVIADSAKRIHPSWGVHQLFAPYILNEVLVPELPDNAFASIAFTTSDLWPQKGWNFVFGLASLRKRVGVWSLARFGDPNESDEAYHQCLARTLKVATHETGHMFSVEHCTAFRCNMQGSNNLEESDGQPLFLCPQCHAKILHATQADPLDRYQKLIEFCKKHGLQTEEAYFKKAHEKLSNQ